MLSLTNRRHRISVAEKLSQRQIARLAEDALQIAEANGDAAIVERCHRTIAAAETGKARKSEAVWFLGYLGA